MNSVSSDIDSRSSLKRMAYSLVLFFLINGLLYAGDYSKHKLDRVESEADTPAIILNVKDFGAKGDGVTDDYEAMKRAAAKLCATPGAALLYPPGTYYVAEYRIDDGPNANQVTDINYTGCKNVIISGYGAIISVNGNFKRTSDLTRGRYHYSWSNSVVPFSMIESSGFVIEGFELNGNADKMTKDAGMAEGFDDGIATRLSSNYVLRDLDIHHFASDGIYLGATAGKNMDTNVLVERVNSHNNGRQGMSIIQVRGARIINSTFSDTGKTGSYGVHAPSAGVDVEPNVETSPKTGDIHFINCKFINNGGPQFISAVPQAVDDVSISNSLIEMNEGSQIAFVNSPAEGLTENSTFNLAKGHRVFLSTVNTGPLSALRNVVYRSNTFYFKERAGILADNPSGTPIDFVDNIVNVNEGPSEVPHDFTSMWFRGIRLLARNKFYFDKSGYPEEYPPKVDGNGKVLTDAKGQTIPDTTKPPVPRRYWLAVLTNRGKGRAERAEENEYRTNLDIPGTKYYVVYESNSYGEKFMSGQHFMPYTDIWDTSKPYSVPVVHPADTASPTISNVNSFNLKTSALVEWTTNEAATTQVRYGATTRYGSMSPVVSAVTVYHPVILTNLKPNTTYHYQVISKDAAGNVATSADKIFTTAPSMTLTIQPGK